MDWLTLIERLGLPVAIIIVFVVGAWRAIPWVANRIDRLLKHLVAMVDATRERVIMMEEHSRVQADCSVKIEQHSDHMGHAMDQIEEVIKENSRVMHESAKTMEDLARLLSLDIKRDKPS